MEFPNTLEVEWTVSRVRVESPGRSAAASINRYSGTGSKANRRGYVLCLDTGYAMERFLLLSGFVLSVFCAPLPVNKEDLALAVSHCIVVM